MTKPARPRIEAVFEAFRILDSVSQGNVTVFLHGFTKGELMGYESLFIFEERETDLGRRYRTAKKTKGELIGPDLIIFLDD